MLMIPLTMTLRKPEHHLPILLRRLLLLDSRHRLPHIGRRVASPIHPLAFIKNPLVLIWALGMRSFNGAALLTAGMGGCESGVDQVVGGEGWGEGFLEGWIHKARVVYRLARG